MLKNASTQKDQNYLKIYKSNLSFPSSTRKFQTPNFYFKTDLNDSSNVTHNNCIKLVIPTSNSKLNTENTSLSKKSRLYSDSIREHSSLKLSKKKSDLYTDSIRELSSKKILEKKSDLYRDSIKDFSSLKLSKKKSDLYTDSIRELSSKKISKKKSDLSEVNNIRNTAYNHYKTLISKPKKIYNNKISNTFDINKEKPVISKNIFESIKNNNNLKNHTGIDFCFEYNRNDVKSLKTNDKKIDKLAKSLYLDKCNTEKEEEKELFSLPDNFIKIKNGYFNGMNIIISPDQPSDSKRHKKNRRFSRTYLKTETPFLNKTKNIFSSPNSDFNDNNKQSIYSIGNSSSEAGGNNNKNNLKNNQNLTMNINNIFYNNSKININYDDENDSISDKMNNKERKDSDYTFENEFYIDPMDLPIYLREKYNIRGTCLLSPFCLKARDEFLYKKIFYDYELRKKIKLTKIVNNKLNLLYSENERQYDEKLKKYNLKLKKQGKKKQHLEGPNPIEVKLFDMGRKVKFMKKIVDYAYPNMVLCKMREEKKLRNSRLRNAAAISLPPFKRADELKKIYERSLESHLKQSINIDKLE